MSHSEIHQPASLLARCIDWLQQRARRGQELANLSRADLDYLASDLGITQADLTDMLPRAADNSFLMDRMMVARGLDPEQVRRTVGALVRDMELVCTRCHAVRLCRRDLKAGLADENCHDYCENAETMDDLLQHSAQA